MSNKQIDIKSFMGRKSSSDLFEMIANLPAITAGEMAGADGKTMVKLLSECLLLLLLFLVVIVVTELLDPSDILGK